MTDYKVEMCEAEKEKIINDSLPFIKYTAYRLAHRLIQHLAQPGNPFADLLRVGI